MSIQIPDQSRKPLILLVDDMPVNLHVLAAALKSDYRIKTATSGQAALELAAQQDKPELILLDVMMPGMSGVEVMRQLRQNQETHDIPVIFVSADSTEQSQLDGLELGADDYLVKPVAARVLQVRVRILLERKQAERQLRLAAHVFESSGEAIIITDKDNCIIKANSAFTRITGYSLEEMKGKNPNILSAGYTDREIYVSMWHGIKEHGFWQGELWDRNKDGRVYPKFISISVVRDANNNIEFHIASFSDITERKAAEEKIQYLAHHDALTKLPNRYTLTQRLKQALGFARRNHEKVAVMFLDMDRFKVINDSMGHDVGDQLLIQVAQRLESCVRATDIVARLGGDEFVVVVTEVDTIDMVFRVADKILKNLGRPYSIAGHEFNSSPSIGIALFPDDGESVEDLMKNADTAMYHAKKMGRNNFQYFEGFMNQATAERLTLEGDMRLGLERGEFVLHYQPQVSLKTGRVVGVEALVRWQHPAKGRISPVTFIPVAEETGLILPLGEWIMRDACRQLKAFADAGILDVRISVNLSARQFGQKTLAQTIAQLVGKDGLDPAMLEFEITESVAMNNPQDAVEAMWMLRGIGVRLVIDDFGTGYSSLSYLKKFPVSCLKIDRSFVKDIETDPNDAAICTATIALAHTMGMDVVAEGAETQAQHDYLKRLGCDVIQGYYFSEPLTAEDVETFIAERHSKATYLTEVTTPANILVIDDDELVCNFLKLALEHISHKPVTETDPVKALEMVRQNPDRFGLVMVDLVMPGMSGIDLVKAVREANRKMPIIIASALKAEETRKTFHSLEQAYNLILDVNYFILEKPLLVEDVCAVVSKAL